MDAVLFLKTISRMCNNYNSQCNGCPIAIEIKRKKNIQIAMVLLNSI